MSAQALTLALIALAVGTLAPIQMAANAQLARGVAGTIAATIISFSAGWLFLVGINAVGFRQFPTVSDIARTPLYLLLVGRGDRRDLCQRQRSGRAPAGAAATACLVIGGQLIGAMIVDRLGLFDFTVREVSAGRLVGVALVLSGALLVRLT